MLRLLFLIVLLCFLKPSCATGQAEVLASEQAFQLTAKSVQANQVRVSWTIAPGYYLYRDRLKFTSLTPGISLGTPVFPAGIRKADPFNGTVETYRDNVTIALPINRQQPKPEQLALELVYQGCAEGRVCFMPSRQIVSLSLPEAVADDWDVTAALNRLMPPSSDQNSIAASFNGKPIGLVIASFLGFGLLLAFTPCVFPMIPILSGIIVGQGAKITTFKAFTLSLSYVLASALTYTLFGVLAGLFGNNLQIYFQEPLAIMAFSAVFVLLALSMLGVFQLQMPTFLQNRLLSLSTRQQSGSWLGAAVMGMFSALAVGPCVTAPLAGALIYIGQSGDALLGGLALFFLGLGMGIPLLIIGTSAGKLLPKSGAWMNATKTLFGMGMLAVAVWLLSRVVPASISLLLWGLLLFLPMLYLGRRRLWKSAAAVLLAYGLLVVVGIATDKQRDAMQLLCTAAVACDQPPALPFQKINSVDDLRPILLAAQNQGKWLMLDFFADWCVACQEMEHYTFTDPNIQKKLATAVLVQADVTANSPAQQALMKQFGLVGPPAILFFNPQQQEQKGLRVIGFMDNSHFTEHLKQVLQ